ncbi:MAG: RHS repeat-associated core domain-containing protein, partial [Desulfatitalea sp.]
MPTSECQELSVLNAREGCAISYELVSGAGSLNGSTYCAPEAIENCEDKPVIKVVDCEGVETTIKIGLHSPDNAKIQKYIIAQPCTRSYSDWPSVSACYLSPSLSVACCWETIVYTCDGSKWRESDPQLNGICCEQNVEPGHYAYHYCQDKGCPEFAEFYAENYPAEYKNPPCCPDIGGSSSSSSSGGPPPPPPPPPPGPPPGGGCEEGQCCTSDVGNPVSILDGAKKESQEDFSFPGAIDGFALKRYYNSLYGATTSLGHGWNHTYGPSLTAFTGLSYDLLIRNVDGTGAYFKKTATTTYTGLYTEATTVTADASGYTWHRRGGTQYRFDTAGHLVSITDMAGNQKVLTYNSQARLHSVTDQATSRTITFEYNGDGRISQITGPATTAVPNGIWVQYQYDAAGNLTDVIYPDGTGFVYLYTNADFPNHLTGKRNRSGRTLASWSYDTKGRAITNQTVSGEDLTLVYGEGMQDNQVTVTDADGITKTYTLSRMDGIKRVLKVDNNTGCGSGCSNSANRYSYDENYNVIQTTYANGRIDQAFDFTALGYPQKEIQAVGTNEERVFYYTYHPQSGDKMSLTEESVLGVGDKQTIFDYDNDGDNVPNEAPTGQVHRKIERGFTLDTANTVLPYEYVTTYTYIANGKVQTIDGPLPESQDMVSYTYDPNTGDKLTESLPLVGTTTYTYDAAGNVNTVTDVNGVVTTFAYDGRNRMLSTTRNGVTESRTYTEAGELETTTDAVGRTMTHAYTPEGFLDTVTDPAGNYMANTYNGQGRRIEASIHAASGAQTHFRGYDYGDPAVNLDLSPGKPWKTYHRNHNDTADLETVYSYDVAGNVKTVTDANLKTTIYGYDLFNRIKQVEQSGQAITRYEYDWHGNLTAVTDAEGHATTYLYDDLGRLVQTNSPDTGMTAYAYDTGGHLRFKIQNGKSTEHQYDALGRLTHILYADSTQNVTNVYDTGSGQHLVGRLASTVDAGGSVQYSYDAFGRMVSQARTVGSHSFTTGYGYDAAGNLRSITYPTGQTIQYLPDAVDPARTSAVRLNGTQTLASGLTYKPFGPMSALTFGNGIALSMQYDKNYQVGAIAATGIMDRTYTPDNVGNIAQIIDNLDNSRSQSFGYDDHYRLTSAAGVYGSIGYTYDRVGNRLSQTDAAGTDAYAYLSGTNKLRTVSGPHAKSYSFDADGNTIAALGGPAPLLTNQADYDYSSNGQRSKKAVDSQTAISHYDQAGQLIAETDAGGTLVKAYVWLNGQPLAMLDAAGAVYYFHNDHLGTPQKMTNATRTVVWAADYLPFGQANVTVATVENNLRFAGQYYDNETGLHYNYHRYYDPKIGRYLRADPIGLLGGIN